MTEKLTPKPLIHDSEWYNFTSDPASKIRIWNQMLDDEEYMMHKCHMWRHYTDYDKEDIRRRSKALMRTMILRACGYVATDFKDSPNNFYRGPTSDKRCL